MTVASLATITHSRPLTRPTPVTIPAPGASPSYMPCAASGGELEERRARVQQPVDALAREQLAAARVARAGLLAAALPHARELLAQVCDQRLVVGRVGLERRSCGLHSAPRPRRGRPCRPRPRAARSPCRRPARSIVSSIFIDSSTTTVWPASTASPTLAATSRTAPGIGARSSPSACAWWTSSAVASVTRQVQPSRREPAVRREREARRRTRASSSQHDVERLAAVDARASSRTARARRRGASRRGARTGRRRRARRARARRRRGRPARRSSGGSAGSRRPIRPGVHLARAHVLVGEQRAQEAGVGGQAEDRGVGQRAVQPRQRGRAVRAVRDHLGDHRVVVGADDRCRSRSRRRRARRPGSGPAAPGRRTGRSSRPRR